MPTIFSSEVITKKESIFILRFYYVAMAENLSAPHSGPRPGGAACGLDRDRLFDVFFVTGMHRR
jgi:hypothetical protein